LRKAKAPFVRQQALTVLCGGVYVSSYMKFWLIFILIFFAVRYLLPIVLRLALSGFVRKQMRNSGFVVPPQARPESGSASRPGEVRVDYVPPTAEQSRQPHDFKGGEYVDFEEVK
jgi:hypothetical protein